MGRSQRVAARSVAVSEQFPAPCRQSRSGKSNYPYLCMPVVKVGKFMPQYMPKYGEFFSGYFAKDDLYSMRIAGAISRHNLLHHSQISPLVVVLSMWSGFA
jgi:hypothetical protein